jgi:uncharacterized membrane protein
LARKPQVPTAHPENEAKPQPDSDLRESIEREIGPLVPQGQRDMIISRMEQIMVRESFSGPIAHPRHLREYESIEPGAANRIIAMAEKQQDHVLALESTAINAEIADRKLGMWLGFSALVLLLSFSALFGYLDRPIIAGLFLTAAAIGSVTAFIRGRRGE